MPHDRRAGFLCTLAKRCTQIDLVLDPGAGETKLRTWTLNYIADAQSGISLLAAVQLRNLATATATGSDVLRPPVRFTYGAFDPNDIACVTIRPRQAILRRWTILNRNPDHAQPGPASRSSRSARGKAILLAQQWLRMGLPTSIALGPVWRLDRIGGRPSSISMATERPISRCWLQGMPQVISKTMDSRDGVSSSPIRAMPAQPQTGRVTVFVLRITTPMVASMQSKASNEVLYCGAMGANSAAAPSVVPAPASGGVIDFSNPLILLADMTGDGSSDVVEISSGSVRYWPNLGMAGSRTSC